MSNNSAAQYTPALEPNTFYGAGKSERKNRVGIRKSAVWSMRTDSPECADFMDGRTGRPFADNAGRARAVRAAEAAAKALGEQPQ